MSTPRPLSVLLAVVALVPASASATAVPGRLDRSRERIAPIPASVPESRPAARTYPVPARELPHPRGAPGSRGTPDDAGFRSGCIGPDVGGDDVLLGVSPPVPNGIWYDNHSMDIAANGDIYAAHMVESAVTGTAIRIVRSTDGGASWRLWSTLADADPNVSFQNCDLTLAEPDGQPIRVFVNYRYKPAGKGSIRVSWADVVAGPPAWTSTDVLSDPNVNYFFSDLVADDDAFSSYYVYLVAEALPVTGTVTELVYLRSFDQGASWETPVTVAADAGTGHNALPRLSWGDAGGGSVTVHLAWTVSGASSSFNEAIRYARATLDGSTWQPSVPMT
ncbi:MAG TPA: hypothetical protein VKU85_20995, partial [bacterium]|nr:hypothetical protein [bacterium]